MDHLFWILEAMLLATGTYVGYKLRDGEMKNYDLRLRSSEEARKRKSDEHAKAWLEQNRLTLIVREAQSAFAKEFGAFWNVWNKCMKKVRAAEPERQDEVRKQIVAGIGGHLRNLEYRLIGTLNGRGETKEEPCMRVIEVTIS